MLFKKKPTPQKPPECNHKYQDFPWFINYSFDVYNKTFNIKVIEPYVCIFCKKRIDKILGQYSGHGGLDVGMAELNKLTKQFSDKIKPVEEVEDMINDMALVDVEYLKYYHMLKGTQDPSTSRTNNK